MSELMLNRTYVKQDIVRGVGWGTKTENNLEPPTFPRRLLTLGDSRDNTFFVLQFHDGGNLGAP